MGAEIDNVLRLNARKILKTPFFHMLNARKCFQTPFFSYVQCSQNLEITVARREGHSSAATLEPCGRGQAWGFQHVRRRRALGVSFTDCSAFEISFRQFRAFLVPFRQFEAFQGLFRW